MYQLAFGNKHCLISYYIEMKRMKESTLVNLVDSEEYEPKGSSQKPFLTTSKHYATPDNLSQKLRLDKKTSLADYFCHKGIIYKMMSVTRP